MSSSLPQWTTELTSTFKKGEDHLGVEGAAQSYQQKLVPGVITTTDHARYYSFYAWVLYRFIFQPNSTHLLRDFSDDYFKPHEVALIVSSFSHHQDGAPLSGLVGGGVNNYKARRMWESGNSISLDQNYFTHKLGGFGQYYRTAMEAMGIVAPSERPTWVYQLTPRGKQLAEAYEQSIAGTAYSKSLERNKILSRINRETATEYGEVGCICTKALARGKDRKLLRDAFFRFDQTGKDNFHVRRRRTLGVALDLVYNAREQLETNMIRPALYLGEYEPGRLYHPAKQIQKAVERWRLVEIRHMYTFGLQCLWAAFLLRLHEKQRGLTFDEFLEWACSSLARGVAEQPVRRYLGNLCRAVGVDSQWEKAPTNFHDACRQKTERDEYTLFYQAQENNADSSFLLNTGLQILAQFFLRFFPRHQNNDAIWREMSQAGRLPIEDFFAGLVGRLMMDPFTVNDLLRWLYRESILGQHEFIALEKLRYQKYDTYKFYYRDGKFDWSPNAPPDYQEPIRLAALRLFNVLTILTDLGLVLEDDETSKLRLSTDGFEYRQRILNEGSHDD